MSTYQFFIAFFIVLNVSLKGEAYFVEDELFTSQMIHAAQSAVDHYTEKQKIDKKEPTTEFVGFALDFNQPSNANDFKVNIFHAYSELDILLKSYACTFAWAKNSALSCELDHERPMCFYFHEAGQYSVNSIQQAFRETMMQMIAAGTNMTQVTKVKHWQHAGKIYTIYNITSKIDGKSYSFNFSCDDEGKRTKCAPTQETPQET